MKFHLKKTLELIKGEYKSLPNLQKKADYLHNYKSNPHLLSMLKEFPKIDYTILEGASDCKCLEDYITSKAMFKDKVIKEDIVEDLPNYVARAFFLPKNRKIEPHDHPFMLVYSKVLFGRVAITPFEKVIRNCNIEKRYI